MWHCVFLGSGCVHRSLHYFLSSLTVVTLLNCTFQYSICRGNGASLASLDCKGTFKRISTDRQEGENRFFSPPLFFFNSPRLAFQIKLWIGIKIIQPFNLKNKKILATPMEKKQNTPNMFSKPLFTSLMKWMGCV